MSRKPVTPALIEALGTQLADVPVSAQKAGEQAVLFETLLSGIAELRTLPIKDVEPAVLFAPVEVRS